MALGIENAERIRELPGVKQVVLFDITGTPLGSREIAGKTTAAALMASMCNFLCGDAGNSWKIAAIAGSRAYIITPVSDKFYALIETRAENLASVLEKLNESAPEG